MKKLKHSKFKNTGILFELLVRQITADILSNKTDSYANGLLRKYFNESAVLGKEQRLYQLIIEETVSNKAQAETYLGMVLDTRKKLDNRKLSAAKYQLIKEIRDVYPIDDFLRSKIRNYKTYASVYKLFESQIPEVYCDPKEIFESRNTVLDVMCSTKTSSDEIEAVVEKFQKQEEDLRLISYKLLVDSFNRKYKSLNEDQKTLLQHYINNISNTNSLREYVNEQVPIIKKKIKTLSSQVVDDDVVQIKLKEVLTQLDKISEGRLVKDSQVSTLLLCYELIKELQTHEKV